jgi:hypothetical protein
MAAPLVLMLGLVPAAAQQTPPAPAPAADPSNSARSLESEIEDYPGPNDGVRSDSDPATRIPEEISPAPKKPKVAPRPAPPEPSSAPSTASSSPPSSTGGTAPGRTSIDPSEVQRVFGSDARLIALSSLDTPTVTRLQVRLRALGHYAGPVDGIAGPQTRAAIEKYARAQYTLKQKLIAQDQLTSDLAEQLGVEPSSRGPEQAPPLPEDTGPSMRRDAPLLPPGGAPLPPPGMTPLPTPSSAPPHGGRVTPPPAP